jgi:hypothetical protein
LSCRPRRTRHDSNQIIVINQLRDLGYSVDIICDLPGLYDLVVCKGNYCLRVELKAPGGKLTESEKQYQENLIHPRTYLVAYCTADVLQWFEAVM